MAISRDTSERIKELLGEHPEGISITDISRLIRINRNTVSRYLDTLLVSGQVEIRHFGMAKLYSLAQRLPVSSVLSLSSEYVLQVDNSMRIAFINRPFLDMLRLNERDLVGIKIDYSILPVIFAEEYPRLLRWISEGLLGIERRGEIRLESRDRILGCRVAPMVFTEGQRGVSVIFEDITSKRQDEAKLQESEERYRTLVEISPHAVILHRDGIIRYANPAALRIFGADSPGEFVGKPILSFIQPQYVDAVRQNIREDLRGRITPPLELEMIRLDGTPIVIEGQGVRTFLDGEPTVLVTMQDITGRKQAETLLRESERKARLLMDVPILGAFIIDREGTVLDINKTILDAYGIEADQIIGMPLWNWSPPEVTQKRKERVEEALRTRKIVRYEDENNGRYLDITITPIPEDSGEVTKLAVLTFEVTEKRAAVLALQRSEARLQTIIRSAPIGIGLDADRTIMEANDQFCTMTGYTQDGVIGKPARILYDSEEEYKRVGTERIQQTQERGSASIETRWKKKDGELIDVLLNFTPLDDQDPHKGIIFTALDISARKQSELALRASEERYRQLLERSFDAVIIHKGGKILAANDAAVAIAGGSSRDDLIGKEVRSFVHPDSAGIVFERIDAMLRKPGMSVPLIRETFLRLDGKPVRVEVMAVSFDDNGSPAIQIIFREITKAVEMEERLKRSEEIYRTLAESAVDIICIVDPDGNITYANAACARLFGRSADDLAGRKLEELAPPKMARRHYEYIRDVICSGIPYEHEEDFPTAAGIIRLDIKLSPIKGPDGSGVSVVVIARDISGRTKNLE